jgi:hypothetical protein
MIKEYEQLIEGINRNLKKKDNKIIQDYREVLDVMIVHILPIILNYFIILFLQAPINSFYQLFIFFYHRYTYFFSSGVYVIYTLMQ